MVLFTATKKEKTSIDQYEMYIQFKKQKYIDETEAFEKLCLQLNSERNGVQRTAKNWKRVK